jgi:hypothetical protein
MFTTPKTIQSNIAMLPSSNGSGQRPENTDNNIKPSKPDINPRRNHLPLRPPNPTPNPNPDTLIYPIPFPELAIGAFHSMAFEYPPHRDMPSNIIGTLGAPELSLLEPPWTHYMTYFNNPPHRFANLQDLYMYITRIALPNAIIINRRTLLLFYLGKGNNASPYIRLRYDEYGWKGVGYVRPEMEHRASFMPVLGSRPILRDLETPNGRDMMEWLRRPISMPLGYANDHAVPYQIIHRPSQLDMYLQEEEDAIRRIHPESLVRRTEKVLGAWWCVMQKNVGLEAYRQIGWRGIEREFFG